MAKLFNTIYIDLDDVLVNWVKGACEAHGICFDEVQRIRRKGHWDILPTFQSLLTSTVDPDTPFTYTHLWEPIVKHGPDFWSSLEDMPWLEDLLQIVDRNADEWFILTNPENPIGTNHSHVGKTQWALNHAHPLIDIDRIICFKHKWKLAREGSLLIDDSEYNCVKFFEHGGDTVLFPTLGNRNHKQADNPLDFVTNVLWG